MSDDANSKGTRARSSSSPENLVACEDDDYDEHARWAAQAWPTIDLDVEAIVSRVEHAQRYLERAAVDTRDQVGLAHGELKVLLRLARGIRSQGELAKALLVSTGTMTNQLDKLEAAGLVMRLPDPDDRRGKLVEMTRKGRETLDNYINVQAKREQQLLGRLSAAEKRQLNDLLRKLLASLGDKPQPPAG
ncbi:MAG: MarR family transcriptional regulator [Acidimicrobiales bacterium]|jgi:DNA-binding MarR family transcriptional regulator